MSSHQFSKSKVGRPAQSLPCLICGIQYKDHEKIAKGEKPAEVSIDPVLVAKPTKEPEPTPVIERPAISRIRKPYISSSEDDPEEESGNSSKFAHLLDLLDD